MSNGSHVRVYSKTYVTGEQHAINVLVDEVGMVRITVEGLDGLLQEAGWTFGLPDAHFADEAAM
jgi:hypothetical protein